VLFEEEIVILRALKFLVVYVALQQ